MDEKSNDKIPDDEIDIQSMRKKVLAFLYYPASLLASNIFTCMLFVGMAVLLSISLKYLIPKTYTSSFIIRPIDKNERIHLKILGDIQSLLKLGDYSTLSSELNIDSISGKKISAIQIVNASLKNPIDSTNVTEVTISVSDYNLIIPLQEALLNYLETNPYFFKIKELQKKQIDLEVKQIDKEVVQLDSLKVFQLRNFEGQGILTQNKLILNDLTNPVAAYDASMDRLSKKSNLIARSSFLDNFQLVKSCVVVKQSNFPPRILVICLYLIPIFILLCIFFLHIKIKFKNTQKEDSQ